MKSVAIVTYPGHFFLTKLCLRALQHFYPEIKNYYMIYDDLSIDRWPDYVQDAENYYSGNGVNPYFVPFSHIDPKISELNRPGLGWLRQQIAKLCIDKALPGDQWLLIDGDVVLDQRIEIENKTPVNVRSDSNDNLSIMVANYVGTVLGVGTYSLSYQGQYAITSSFPVRVVARSQLLGIRALAENNLAQDFVSWHVQKILQGDIVVGYHTSEKLIMHEWELIEAYNQIYHSDQFEKQELGNGYDIMTHTSSNCVPALIRHGFMIDQEIGRTWFEKQMIHIPDELWGKSQRITR